MTRIRINKDNIDSIKGETDWEEFNRVINGDGFCNRDRLAHHRKAHEDGQWVRDALQAYENKQRSKSEAA